MSLSKVREEIYKNAKKIGTFPLFEHQSKSILSILEKKNTAIINEPGTGKSLSYVLGLSQSISLDGNLAQTIPESFLKDSFNARKLNPKSPIRGGLVLVPSYDLSLQIYKNFRQIAPWLRVSRTGGSMEEMSTSVKCLSKMIEGNNKKKLYLENASDNIEWSTIDVLISTPTVLNQLLKNRIANNLSIINPKSIVLDEMDLLIENEEYNAQLSRLFKNFANLNSRQFVLAGSLYPYSAHSANPHMILKKFFNDLNILTFGKYDRIPENLRVNIVEIDDTKEGASMRKLVELVKGDSSSKFAVFANYYSRCLDIKNALAENGIESSVCVNETNVEDRILEYSQFGSKNRVMISNDLVARGLDFSMDHTVLYHLPENPGSLISRIGRVTKNGNKGTATVFIRPSESDIIKYLNPGELWSNVFKFYSKKVKKTKFKSILEYDAGVEDEI